MDYERNCVSLSAVTKAGRRYYVAYYPDGRLINPLIDYSMHLSDRKMLDKKSIEKMIRNVASLFNFMLSVPGISPSWDFIPQLHDRLLEKYRDAEFSRIIAGIRGDGETRSVRRTVNGKLIDIYNFLLWYQHVSNLSELIGPFRCRVSCRKVFNENVRADAKTTGYFPLLFRRTGSSSRSLGKYVPGDAEVVALSGYIKRNFTEFAALRNLLVLAIAKDMGWRCGSIVSLECSQFSEERLAKMSDRGLVCVPPNQKFGYQNGFLVPPKLAINVCNFIGDCRASFLQEMGWGEERAEGKIFISAKTGRPISENALSAIFGKAFKAIGAPRRSGLHCLRALFAETKVGDETLARVALGMDTSVTSVSTAVALEMGHRSPESLRAYVNERQSELARRAIAKLGKAGEALKGHPLTRDERARLLKK